MYWVTSIGCFLVTMFLPSKREMYTKWFELDLNTLKPGVDGVHGGVSPRRSTSFALFSAPVTVSGVNESRALVTLTNASVAIHGPKSEVLSFDWLRSLLPDAFMSAKYCLSPGKALAFTWFG